MFCRAPYDVTSRSRHGAPIAYRGTKLAQYQPQGSHPALRRQGAKRLENAAPRLRSGPAAVGSEQHPAACRLRCQDRRERDHILFGGQDTDAVALSGTGTRLGARRACMRRPLPSNNVRFAAGA